MNHPAVKVIVLWLAIVYLATLPPSVVSKPLREQGSHVCPYACNTESYREMYKERYKTNSGWCFFSPCTRYRFKYRIKYRDVMCYECCPGWKKGLGSDECLIPSDKGCGPVVCDSSNSDFDCWDCCEGWRGHDCRTDINECAVDNGGCSHTCVNTVGSYHCDCSQGYTLDPWDQFHSSCVDLDECETNNGGCGGLCSNTQGSFRCSCADGYRLETWSLQCEDIDECAEDNGGCSDTCVNTDGGYRCDCPSGYKVDASGFSCEEINQCEHQNGGCDHNCVKVVGSFHCECLGGHTLAADGLACEDINECAQNNGKCSDTCVNYAGSYVCDCPTGYHLDESGFDCTDTNECSRGNGNCSDTCRNTVGSFYCECPNGFALDNSDRICQDINECSEKTDNCQQICRNTIGSFECVCESGYEKRETRCTDIDECMNLNGGCSDTCVNTIGSYNCECPGGWQVGQGSLKCTDTNECGVNNGDCQQRCINTQGSFYCDCYHGYHLDEQDHSCHDVNECSTLNGGCQEGCGNTDGSFFCTCPGGYQLARDGFRCEDLDECSSDETLCQHTCKNTAGSYMCVCTDGYEQQGDDCIDIDECLENVCQYSCTNSAGSFLCGCPDGMFLDTNGISCSKENFCAGDHGCQQICNSEQNSLFCSCLPGFELISDKECTDIDECSRSVDGCSHNCNNTDGSYVCQCPTGLRIGSDMRTCLDPCSPNPCLHEGVCVRGESGAVCECSGTSYTGDRCQQGIVNVSFDGDVHKGREASLIFVAKPDSSLEIEVNVVGSKAEVTPLKASIVYPSKMATVKVKGLEAGFEALHFPLSGIAASQYVQPEGMTFYVHDVFSRNNISDFTLPTGSYGIEANLQNKIDVVLTSTTPWYSLVRDPDIMFTLGIVHFESGGLKVPVSFRGTELRKGDLPRPVSSYRTEEDGNIVQSRRQRRSPVQSLLKEDIEDLWAHNAIFRTALKLLRPHLPSWLSLEICGDPVYDVIPRTDIMPGLQTKGVPSCSGAPVFDDHLYVVIEIRTDLCIGILDNDVTLDASSEGYVCLLVDLDKVPGSTIIIMLPEDSSKVLEQLKFFSSIKENYGVAINIKGAGFSAANGLNVKDYKFGRTYWVGDRYFTSPTVDDATVWLDLSGEYEKQFGILELKGSGQLELALAAPDILKLVTQPMQDRVRFHLGARAGLLGIYFNIKRIRIPLQPKLDAEMRAYAAVGGGKGFANEKCGSDPSGIFLSCNLDLNPFDVPILKKFLTFDLSVSANVFVTTDVAVTADSAIPSEIEVAVHEMSDMVINLVIQLKARLDPLIGTVSRFLKELLSLTKTETEKIERLVSDIVQGIEYNNFAPLLDAFTILVTGVREVLGEISDIIGTLSYCVEAHDLGIVDDMKVFVSNILRLLSETQWLVIQHGLSAQGGVNGFGIQFTGTLEIHKLVFPQLDMEFVYSNGSLGQCSRFSDRFSLLQRQDAFRIMGFARKPMKKARFFKVKKGAGIEFAYGLDTGDVVATFMVRWFLLGFEAEAEVYVAKEYIGGNIVAKLYNLFMFEAELNASLTKEMILFVKATFSPGPEGFDGSLKEAVHLAAESLADEAAERLSQLQRGLEVAREYMQKGVDWLNKKQDQVDDSNTVFDNAVEKLREANRKVADTQEVVDEYLEEVRDAERNLDRICKIRDCGRVCVPGLKCRTCRNGWLRWVKCCSWTNCMIKIPDVACHGKNTACMTVRALAFGGLQVAKVGLYAARLPFEAAKLGLKGAEFVVDKSRIVLDIAKGALEAAKVSLKALQTAAKAAEDAVEIAKHVLRGALKIAALLLDAILPIDVRRCGFTLELSVQDVFVFGVDCAINLFDTGWLDFNFTINFRDFWQSMVSFARELIKKFASGLGLDRRKRDSSFWLFNDGNNTESKVWLHTMDFADGLTQDEIKIKEYGEKCEAYERIAMFLSISVDLLLEAVNDTKTTVAEMKTALESLQAMPHNNMTNITLDDAAIDADEAFREYNLTRQEMEAAVNESVVRISESDTFRTVVGISSWSQGLIKDQMRDISKYPFIPAWKDMMQNVTPNYFDEEECSNFLDCVIVSFIKLHLLYDGLDLPDSNTTRRLIREVEQQFVGTMLNSTSVTLNEAHTFSRDVLVLLEKMNKTKVFCASPPVIVTNPKNVSVLTGHSFQLTCEAAADPEPAYSWMRDGQLLEGHESNQLPIGHVSKLDAGDYTCIASNHLVSTESLPARVTVEWAPEIDSSQLESLEVLMGFQDEVVLVCNVSASPEAKITWYKDGTAMHASILPPPRNNAASDYYIILPSVSDSGKYWCRAENEYGAATSNTLDLYVRHVVVPTITTTIYVGVLVTQRTGDLNYKRKDLEANITQALELGHLPGSSVTFRWKETDFSGLVLIHISLSNDTTDARMRRKLLKALHKHNLDLSLAVIRQIQSAAYAETEILVSACCRVTYDPSKLLIEGPHTNCPILYEEIDDGLCAKVLHKKRPITTEPPDATSVPVTAPSKLDDSNFKTWILVAVGVLPVVCLAIFFGWCYRKQRTQQKP